jgi:hypothetical protein
LRRRGVIDFLIDCLIGFLVGEVAAIRRKLNPNGGKD